jgi:hypothetical protein
MAERRNQGIVFSESYLKAKEKSPAQQRVDDLLNGKITQAEYGRLLREQVNRAEEYLLGPNTSAKK